MSRDCILDPLVAFVRAQMYRRRKPCCTHYLSIVVCLDEILSCLKRFQLRQREFVLLYSLQVIFIKGKIGGLTIGRDCIGRRRRSRITH
jgi:hypothetical protein